MKIYRKTPVVFLNFKNKIICRINWLKRKRFVKVQVSIICLNDRPNTYNKSIKKVKYYPKNLMVKSKKYSEKYRNNDDAATDQAFDFDAFNGKVGQFDAIVRLELTLYMVPLLGECSLVQSLFVMHCQCIGYKKTFS